MRKLIIFVALFMLLAVPALASEDSETVNVTVTVTEFTTWDYTAIPWPISITKATEYLPEWSSDQGTIHIESNMNWEINGTEPAWVYTADGSTGAWTSNNGDPTDWNIKAQWDGVTPTVDIDSDGETIYQGVAGVQDYNLFLYLTGPSIDEGYGVGKCAVLITLDQQ